jgi:hypothetical protein
MEKFPFDRLAPVTSGGWKQSVQEFTQRSLSYASDRTAAISGLAARNHRLTNERYISGLWQNGAVISQLRWVLRQHSGTSFYKAHSITGAPSWSWLSTTHPTIYGVLDGDTDEDRDFANRIEIIDIDVRPSGPNVFGEFASPGVIVLKAGLLDATLICKQQDATSASAPIYKCTIPHNDRIHAAHGVSVDTPLELATKDNMIRWQRVSTKDPKDRQDLRPGSNAPVKLFAIATAKPRSHSFALVLSPLHGTMPSTVPTYERMGHVLINHPGGRLSAAIAESERTTFCIV